MEPFQATISLTVFIGLTVSTIILFVIVVMMGAEIYKENTKDEVQNK